MNHMELFQFLVYLFFMFSLVAYVTLDGFDLGLGILHLFNREDHEKKATIDLIAPIWDGNTTWLLIGAGILFVGFPQVFAIVMSGFYTPIMLLLLAFMIRGIAVVFRSKTVSLYWGIFCDIAFFLASLLISFLLGIILANLIQGVPLGQERRFYDHLIQLLSPYACLIAMCSISLFALHGSIYLLMKTSGALHQKIRRWVIKLFFSFFVFWVISSITTAYQYPRIVLPFLKHPFLFSFVLCVILSMGITIFCVQKRKDGWAFLTSCLTIIFLMILFIIGTFPYFVYSVVDPFQNSMTLFNSSSSKLTLIVLTIIASTGAPLSFFYFSYIYRIFRGKINTENLKKTPPSNFSYD